MSKTRIIIGILMLIMFMIVVGYLVFTAKALKL